VRLLLLGKEGLQIFQVRKGVRDGVLAFGGFGVAQNWRQVLHVLTSPAGVKIPYMRGLISDTPESML